MSSAKFLEEALSTDVDESAVSDIVGSLENLETATSSSQSGSTQNKVLYPQSIVGSPSNNSNNGKQVSMHSVVIKQGVGNQASRPGSGNGNTIASSTGMQSVVTYSKTQQQNIAVTTVSSAQPSILPGVQIVNVRPGGPLTIQKTMANVSPRVVIGGPQAVATRATQPALTLQTLPGLQPGQPGGAHLLLKTESGQYQLLRVGPAPANTSIQPQTGQTIRMSSIQSPQGIATVSTSVAPMSQQSVPITNIIPPQMQNAPPATGPAPVPQSPSTVNTKPSDNTKEKCRNFLANLLDLSSKEPKSVERNVRNLIQELINDRVQPEEFCDRLERLLNASPQPCLIGFLQKSLPLLRQSMVTKELSIEGIQPPPVLVAYPTGPFTQTITIPANQPAMQSKPMTMTSMPSNAPRPIATPPTKQPVILQNIPIQVSKLVSKTTKTVTSTPTFPGKSTFVKPSLPSTPISLTASLPKAASKEKKNASSFSPSFTDIDKMVADDDINDVAAMGGVNLAEESQRILGSTELIGTQIRSVRDEYMVPGNLMQSRLSSGLAKHGLEDPSSDIMALFSHALQDYLKTIIEKLSVVAEHRIDPLKIEQRYTVTQDIKTQLKFMEDVDRVDRKKREETEREQLLRAAKSRSKTEDPEQAKLKAKAKEMQRAEMEELRQREANLTALQAIGPRKKAKPSFEPGEGPSTSAGLPNITRNVPQMRSRMKRANIRQMIFLLENERNFAHSRTVYINYLKS